MLRNTLAIWFLFFVPSLSAKPLLTHTIDDFPFMIEKIATGLTTPWAMAFVTENHLIVTERVGTVQLLDVSKRKLTPINGVPAVLNDGQGGLLDVATPPDFKKTKWLYFTYVKPVNGKGSTTLARARLKGQNLADWQDLLITKSGTDTSRHFGSRIAFDNNGHVFFSVGDRGDRPNGQNLKTHAGSIIRLNLDGTLPHDNPFYGHKAALPEIWSYGHRNPQGLAYDHTNRRLWGIEHGPRGGDELNLILKGKNYGWPLVSHGYEYWAPMRVSEFTSKPGMEDPKKVYTPSIAPGSLLLYTGNAFLNWQGNLFAGALKLTHLNQIVLDPKGKPLEEKRLLEELNERIRAIVTDSAGLIYLSTDSGKILRLKPSK